MAKGYLKSAIAMLGYDKAEQFYYYDDIPFQQCSKHTEIVLKELRPFAVYMVNYNPFMCFFDIELYENIQDLYWKIWNAQLEIAVCVSDTTIEIYYGKVLRLENKHLNKLAGVKFTADSPLPFSYLEIKSENFWEKYQKQLNERTTLNNVLLQNIQLITDKLKKEYHISFVTKLVLRLIFICYLIDRGINLGYEGFDGDIAAARTKLIELCSDKAALYDFKMIPVDLISNIYEILLGEEGREKDKAFYTPGYLADYIIQQETEQSAELGKILDPACGSGVFLVLYYRKLVEEKRRNGYISDQQLLALVRDNIYGVDKNPEAVCVAAFSLYLTMLDYKDIKTISGFKLPNLIGDNLI